MTNTARRDNKLAPVSPSPLLASVARAFAEYLARSGQFSHTADGKGPDARAEKAGYGFCAIAENIALQQDNRGFEARDLAAKTMTGWINSAGHRANILAPHVTEIGVGIAKSAGAEPKYIAVQLVARPASAAYEFQIVNTAKAGVRYTFAGETHELAPHLSITHQACLPGEVVVSTAPGLVAPAKEIGRFAAENGKLYTLRSDGERIVLDVGVRQKIK